MAKYEIKDGVCIIPEGTTEIGAFAFFNNDALTNIVIPDSVTEIGEWAFKSCGLTSVVIPDSVTKIGDDAFSDCCALTSVVISNSVTKIGRNVFSDCRALTSIKVAEDNPKYDSRGGCNAIIETESNKLLFGCQSTVIPDSVTKIGRNAFSDCCALTSIEIPTSVTEIGDEAFLYCQALTSIKVADDNPKYDSRGGCNAIIETESNKLLFGCQSTVIPDSVAEIGGSAFSHCCALTNIEIPSSVTEIGRWAFFGCTGLTSVVIPDSVTNIGYSAFDNCTGLTSVVIPASVIEMAKTAFYLCSNLTSITVTEGNKVYDSRENCNAIIRTMDNKLVVGCVSTVIPNSVTSIGESAFKGCTGLTSVVIPNSVTSIGESAFNNCTGLTSVVIPNSVTSIGESAFSGTGLTSISIPSVKKIEDETFSGCEDLEEVTLAAGINKIEDWAFHKCSKLSRINVPAKKADYYKKRLPEKLHELIVEMEPEKKTKKK